MCEDLARIVTMVQKQPYDVPGPAQRNRPSNEPKRTVRGHSMVERVYGLFCFTDEHEMPPKPHGGGGVPFPEQ